MHCFVYASQRKAESYLWLASRDDFSRLPDSLVLLLGDLRLVLEVELNEERRLPYEDAKQVLAHLRGQGWHLQLPPKETLATANHLPYRSAPRQDDSEE